MLKRTLLLGVVLASASFAYAVDDTDPEPPKPDLGPVSMKIVAKKTTYKLDLQGMTAAEFAKAAKAGKASPIAVQLEMVLTNNTKTPVRVRTSGSTNRVTLALKGPGAVESGKLAINKGVGKLPAKKITYVILAPGEKVSIPLEALTSNTSSAQGQHHYWTQAGDYTLEATFRAPFYLDFDPNKGAKITYLEPKATIKLKVEK